MEFDFSPLESAIFYKFLSFGWANLHYSIQIVLRFTRSANNKRTPFWCPFICG